MVGKAAQERKEVHRTYSKWKRELTGKKAWKEGKIEAVLRREIRKEKKKRN